MAKNAGQGDGLKHKIKSFLGLKKNKAVQAGVHEDKETDKYIFSNDVLKELSKENNFNHRSRVLKELCEVVSSRQLEEHAVEAVWHEIEDLLDSTVPIEPRQTALKFLVCLALGQNEKLGLLRAQFLRFIENHDVKEDLNLRIELMRAITDNGKDVSYCEHIGPFLLAFTTQALNGDRPDDFMHLLINFMHYNSSFLEKEVITGLVEQTCEFCNRAKDEKEIESCLLLLDATVRYGGLPSEGLYPLITTLCRTVNIEKFCQASWKLMKTLVGTRLGNSSIYIMCCILEDENNLTESILLRGAVFFIGMCVWGSKRVYSLQHKPISLLPSFRQALYCNHPIVAHEIGLSLQRLVKKYGKDLKIVTWDIIFDLVDMLFIKMQQTLSSSNDSLRRTVHDLLTNIEELYTAGKFDGETVRLFAIIERCSSQRPEASVLTLLSYLNEKMHPAKDGWLEKIKFVMEKYFSKETRTNIRVKVLDMLSAIITSFRFWYEEELIEIAVLAYLNNIDIEPDASVRRVTAQLLIDLIVTCNSTKCMDILSIINKLIRRPIEANGNARNISGDQSNDEEWQLQDVKIAVNGLVAAFKQKLFESPPSMAIRILEILVDHISDHYTNGFVAETGSAVRYEVFRLFLSIRADNLHRIGVLDQQKENKHDEIRYSVFITCNSQNHQGANPSVITNPVCRKLSLSKECPTHKAFEAVLNCLKDEWDWNVLEYVLNNLPDQLQNKSLILGSNSDVTTLCTFLCKMVNDVMYLNKVKNVPTGSGKTELHNLVFPILAVLVTYHDAIEKLRQIDLVKSLEFGLNSQCSRLCVIYLTICTLEMKSIMLRTLPSILIKLSKISATALMSIPMLEFLSSLKEIKSLYSNFVEEQYMSIFAIALPYTDSYRYPPYTVTLAHYVIASWFTRCRLSFRKGFVRLITKGLQSSTVLKPSTAQAGSKQTKSSGTSSIEETQEFHNDMTIVCSDMMAKYSFSALSNQPKRSQIIEFLLSNGLSQSWLVGNTLVTVTTSGASIGDCAVCAENRVKVKAAKAAEKVRCMEQIEDNKLEKDKFDSDIGVSDHTIQLKTKESAEEKHNDDRTTTTLSSVANPDPFPVAESIKHSVESEDNLHKTLAYQVVDQSVCYQNTDTMNILEVDRATKLEEEANILQSDCSKISPKIDQDNFIDVNVADEEVSLMNKLTLQQQKLAVGQMFSPSEYLFNTGSLLERRDYLTASLELEETVCDQPGDFETLKTHFTQFCIPFDKEAPYDKGIIKECKDGGKQREIEATVDDVETFSDERKGQEDVSSETHNTLPINLIEESTLSEDFGEIHSKSYIAQSVQNESLFEKNKLPSYINPEQQHKITESNISHMASSTPSPQDSSVQETPVTPRKTSFQTSLQASLTTSIELSSEYELVDNDDASSVKGKDFGLPDTLNDMASFPLCSCSCEGWAEILIRRPTGNTSWIMKIENDVALESEAGKLGDVVSLAASIEGENYRSSVGHYFEPLQKEPMTSRPRFLSIISDEMSRERQSTRSSSDNLKPVSRDIHRDCPSNLPRRRFSTGSLEFPGDFWLNLPSPDPNTCKDEASQENSFHKAWKFEKPSLGLSPVSSLKRQESFNCTADLNEKRGKSSKEPSSSKTLQNEGSRLSARSGRATKDLLADKTLYSKTKTSLSKSISSPLKIEKNSAGPPLWLAGSDLGSCQMQTSKKRETLLDNQDGTTSTKASKFASNPSELISEQSILTKTTESTVMKETSTTTEHQEIDKLNESRRFDKKDSSKKSDFPKTGAQTLKDKLPSFRPRGQTISAFPLSVKTADENKDRSCFTENWLKSSLNPYYVFLQFFYSPFMSSYDVERPLLLGSGEIVDRSIKMLDRIPPYDHHKIGILYVGPQQQSNETAILANEFGSSRYIQFLSGLGDLVCLPECCPTEIYTGGLDRNGADGKFAYSWRDDITQVIFHVATLMPNKSSDPACNSKKLHIGNNFVTIVYNDSKATYKFGTMKGQFNFAEILVKPLDYESNVVVVRVKEDLKHIVTNTGPHVISDSNLPILVRQLAIHTNMATVLQYSQKKANDAYGCNWLERLKQIKRIRSKATAESQGSSVASHGLSKRPWPDHRCNDDLNSDFTDYT